MLEASGRSSAVIPWPDSSWWSPFSGIASSCAPETPPWGALSYGIQLTQLPASCTPLSTSYSIDSFFSSKILTLRYWVTKASKALTALAGLTFSKEPISRGEGLHCDCACLMFQRQYLSHWNESQFGGTHAWAACPTLGLGMLLFQNHVLALDQSWADSCFLSCHSHSSCCHICCHYFSLLIFRGGIFSQPFFSECLQSALLFLISFTSAIISVP